MTGLVVLSPLAITDAMLVSTDVPEADYAAYNAGTTYGVGARVIVVATHTIYESVQAANTGHDPALATVATPTAWWIVVSPTNRWKLLDNKNSSRTVKATSLYYRFTPGSAINAVLASGIVGATSIRVRVIDPVYGTVRDVTTDLLSVPSTPSWWHWFFGARRPRTYALQLDLPPLPNAEIRIDLAGGADLAIGVLLLGQTSEFGEGIRFGASGGIRDFSKQIENTFGDLDLQQGAYAKRRRWQLVLGNDEIDAFEDFLASKRATPCYWIGYQGYAFTQLWGIASNFEVVIKYATRSECDLDLKGMT